MIQAIARPDSDRSLSNQSLLHGAGHEASVAVEKPPAHEASRARSVGTLDVVKDPLVHAEGAVKPDRVIEARDLHPPRQPAGSVRVERCPEEREVRRVCEQVAVQGGVVGQSVDHPVPEAASGRVGGWRERVSELHGANLDRALGGGSRSHGLGQHVRKREGEIALRA